MAAIIRSGATTDQWTIDATAKAGRVTLYSAAGTAIGAAAATPIHTLPGTGRSFIGLYSCSTWRTLGTAATPQNIASIENPAASAVALAVRRMTVQSDSTAVLVTVAPSIKSSMPSALPTGGTVIPAVRYKSSYAAAVAVVRGGTASDGGVATAITATADNTIWTQLESRLHTAVGQVLFDDNNLLPDPAEDDPFFLLAGEAILVQGVTASAATTHFVVNFYWEEYTP